MTNKHSKQEFAEEKALEPKIQEKEVVSFSDTAEAEQLNEIKLADNIENEEKNEEHEAAEGTTVAFQEEQDYYQTKETDHTRILSLISQAEEELADLKLRKSLMESDFSSLLHYYQALILPGEEISAIAKKTLLEYFSYELLRGLNYIGLKQADTYDVWETKHFLIKYQLTQENNLELSFRINPINQQFTSKFMQLLLICPDQMKVEVNDEQVLQLIRLWHKDKIYSINQLSLFNYDINLLFKHLTALDFSITPSLLDNTQALAVDLISDFSLTGSILDDIFITAMEESSYDFEKLADDFYEVLLDKGQRVTIKRNPDQTELFIDSKGRKRSLLDFFTNYAFLVPLVVRSLED